MVPVAMRGRSSRAAAGVSCRAGGHTRSRPIADPARVQRYPFVPGGLGIPVARAEGAWLVLADGRHLRRAIVANVGHGRREVAAAVARTLEATSYLVPPFATDERIELAERLVERWLRVDRRCPATCPPTPRRSRPPGALWKMIGRDLSYHGTTLATLAVGGHEKRRAGLAPLLLDWPKAPACYCLRCPLGLTQPTCHVACVDAVETLIEREGPETVAAVVAEPVVGSTAGALVPPSEYWWRLAEICRRHGVLLIAVELVRDRATLEPFPVATKKSTSSPPPSNRCRASGYFLSGY